MDVVDRELTVFFRVDYVPFGWLVVVRIDDVSLTPSDSMKSAGDAGVVPPETEKQIPRCVSFGQEIIASYKSLRGKHVAPSQTSR